MENHQSIAHELIGLIYETAQNPHLWPVLLEGLSSAVNEETNTYFPGNLSGLSGDTIDLTHINEPGITQLNQNTDNDTIDNHLVQNLLPHFQRALKINRQLAEYKEQRDSAINILERLPLGIIMVTTDGTITSMNQQARHILESNQGLQINNNRISTAYPDSTRSLYNLIKSATNEENDQKTTQALALPHNGHQLSISLLISPTMDENSAAGNLCGIFIAAPETRQPISTDVLIELYQLTPTEARLTQTLIQGKSLSETATALNISQHTAKQHLKSVFQKTGTHRQAELIGKILTSPAILHNPTDNTNQIKLDKLRPNFQNKVEQAQYLRLNDGRNLCYVDYGHPQGKPVLFFHSTIACRLQGPPNTSQFKDLGIRLIIPDRPGFGQSSYQKDRSLLSCADDIQQLADNLKLDRFYLAGYSAGGAFAAACAYRMPKRCRRLGLISSMAPFQTIKDLAGMKSSAKMILSMARYAPALLMPLMRIMARGITKDPASYFRRFASDWPVSDQSLLDNPAVIQEMAACFIEAVCNGTDGLVDEQFILAQPWGFELNNIQAETMIWHGDADTGVPYDMSLQFSTIPSSKTHTYPNEGHLLIVEHWQEIFSNLTN